MLQVSALYIYPIKSCAGIALNSARVESRGLQFDRRFMLVDDSARFLTQRQMPKMALLKTAIEGDTLHISRPDGAALSLALQPSPAATLRVRVWRSELDVGLADAQANSWFSEFLERSVRLVYMADHQHRRVSRERATQPNDEVSFADGAPLLLIGEASLAELNARLPEAVSMRRFRPNIVVNTTEAFEEDDWRRIRIGETPLEMAWSCSRCTMTTVDPDTGIADAQREPLQALREFRREGNAIMFGQNVLPRGGGVIRVGDGLEVLEER